ncbi:hypothetical protein BGW80DRAFT_60340 [Lactifluus volemus]|nr:hypothetical protein BGW80DRAFT_60340 [Lactifluus volemus]
MEFIDGSHCTIIDPCQEGDAHALRAKARSLVARFEKLGQGRDKIMVAVSGILQVCLFLHVSGLANSVGNFRYGREALTRQGQGFKRAQ